MRWLAVVLLLGCGSRPGPTEAAPRGLTPWCASYVVEVEGQEQQALGCGETLDLCERQRRTAQKYGGLVHVTGVGECGWVP